MQQAPNVMPTPATQSTASAQTQQMAYETQYYYAAPMPTGAQPMPAYVQTSTNGQNFAPQPAPAYYQDSNAQYMGVPQQNALPQQPIVMQGQPYMYMQAQPASGPQPQPQIIYYPQPIPQQQAVYYQPVSANGQVMNDQMNSVMQVPVLSSKNSLSSEVTGQRGPLTSSTPLPTNMEYEKMSENRKNIQFRYHRVMEHDENFDNMVPIDEISKITIDNANDDTMSAEKENNADQKSDKSSRRGIFNSDIGRKSGQDIGTYPTQTPHNYKTRLCMMHASGTKPCEMGSRCKFAHGLKELRTVDMPIRVPNNKYKTKLCKNFARGGTGFCPYGLRCEFVHPTDKEFENIPVYQRMQVDENCFDSDITPDIDDYLMTRNQRMVQRGSGKSHQPGKVLLKHRNVAGSMMCLSQTGKDSSVAGGDFNKQNNSHENAPPHFRSKTSNRSSTQSKGSLSNLSRRLSMSQLKTKWTSEENIGRY